MTVGVGIGSERIIRKDFTSDEAMNMLDREQANTDTRQVGQQLESYELQYGNNYCVGLHVQ